MEPLRPPESGSTTRKRGKRDAASRIHPGGFAQRLETERAIDSEQTTGEVDAPQPNEIDEELETLLDNVHSSGQDLLDRRSYTAAQHYRAAIRAFLRKVVPDAISIETIDSSHDILKRKRYTLLKEVDRKVDRLISGILQSQTQQIEMMARLREIEGMLVDLLH